jgi:SAM-dependent methyltransferase
MKIYGKNFAYIYNKKWAFWGPKMWPFLRDKVETINPSSESWLDLCCGTGSLLKFIRAQGFRCVGVDVSPYQIKHAKNNVPEATFLVQDIRRLSLPQSFDVITCMFDSLNYLRTKHDLVLAFKNALKHLRPNGLFIFDMNTYEGLEYCWRGNSVGHYSRYTIITESSFDKKKAIGRCLFTIFMREKHLFRKFQEEHIERGYKHKEIENCLRVSGFRFTKYNGDSLKPAEARPRRLLYVCRRKKENK